MTEDLNDWFVREVLIHEDALMRFLARVWPDAAEVADLCHETYLRIYESAAISKPVSTRGFLFATARHLMVDRVRRGKIVSIEFQGDLELLNVLIDEVTPERRISAQQELWQLAEAFQALPSKYREIMWMVKVEELTQREIAERLKLTVKIVEKRVAQGMHLLQNLYIRGGYVTRRSVDAGESKDTPEHG